MRKCDKPHRVAPPPPQLKDILSFCIWHLVISHAICSFMVCVTRCRPLQDKKREHQDRGSFVSYVKAEVFADCDFRVLESLSLVRSSKRRREGRAPAPPPAPPLVPPPALPPPAPPPASPPAQREETLCPCSPVTGCVSAGVRSTAPGRTEGRGTPLHRTWEETRRECVENENGSFNWRNELDLRLAFQCLHLVFDTRGRVVFKVGILWLLKMGFTCSWCVWDLAKMMRGRGNKLVCSLNGVQAPKDRRQLGQMWRIITAISLWKRKYLEPRTADIHSSTVKPSKGKSFNT